MFGWCPGHVTVPGHVVMVSWSSCDGFPVMSCWCPGHLVTCDGVPVML